MFYLFLAIDDPIFLLQNEDGFNNTNSSLNMSDFECSSFVGLTDSEIETSMQANSSESLLKSKNVVRTPLKLPTPSVQLSENLKNDFLTSTPVNKSGGNATVERDASWTVDSKTDTENTTFEEGNKTGIISKHDFLTCDSFATRNNYKNDLLYVIKFISDDSAGPWPKKFRRRNIAMYSSNDDD